jgi:hypothetical protein
MQLALATFANACVVSSLRERFLHEAVKRPDKLHERVCHHTAKLLEPRFAGGKVTFKIEDPCLMIQDSKGFKEVSWAEAERLMDGYGGLLVISLAGGRFYCESEASPTRQVWAGSF